MKGRVYSTVIDDWKDAVRRLLSVTDLCEKLQFYDLVIIKPNLVEAIPPPVTTPVKLVEELIVYLQGMKISAEIVVGEGTGSIHYDTYHCFKHLGYDTMAENRSVELLDLNEQPLIRKENRSNNRLPELFIPQILQDGFLLSVPVLKVHTMAGVTLTMKNMMGCMPPSHYREGNNWGKSHFHYNIQQAIFELNQYRAPDFTLLDASVGMSESHLWGAFCNPPVGRLVASWDAVAIDSFGCSLLGRKWHEIGHIQMAHKKLGQADPLEIIEC